MGIIQAGNLARLFNMRQIGEIVFYAFPDNLFVDSMGVGRIPTVDIYYAKVGNIGMSVFTTTIRQQYIDSLMNRERNMFFSSLLYTMKLIGSRFLITVDSISDANRNRKTYLITNSSRLVGLLKNKENYVLIKNRRMRNSLALIVSMARFQNIPAIQVIFPIREVTESKIQHSFQNLIDLIKDVMIFVDGFKQNG
ncbi:MAG: hypothetical protein ACUVQY_08205 [Thermoproteota archaeon]